MGASSSTEAQLPRATSPPVAQEAPSQPQQPEAAAPEASTSAIIASSADPSPPPPESSTSTEQQSEPKPPTPTKKKKKTWEPLQVPSAMEIMQQDIMNNCLVKGTFSGAMGGLAGMAFGLFTASLENAGAGPGDLSLDVRDKPTRVVLREMFNNMKDKSLSYARGFAYFGALYSFNECVIEKFRAKHDKVNPALAGCATGAMMAYGGGPGAMCFGCVSVGAFSVAIEHFLDM